MCVDLSIYRARIGLFICVTCKLKCFKYLNEFECLLCLSLILLQCGDIEKNPGPLHRACPEFSLSNNQQHLSAVHYNVQSFYHKKDILFAELSDFDIISLTETWLMVK